MTSGVTDRTASPASDRAWPRSVPPRTWQLALLVVGALVVWQRLAGPVLQVVLGLGLLVALPMLLVARRWRRPGVEVTESVLYALGAVLLAIMLGGFLANQLLGSVGVARPLRLTTWVALSTAANACLLWWAPSRRQATSAPAAVVVTGPAVLATTAVALAVTGAARLNNGAGPQLAVAALLCLLVGLVWLLVSEDSGIGQDAVVLYLVSAALLLATSMRGWFVTGHDVQREFFFFTLTQQPERWDVSALPDAYNACLSVTLLPVALSSMSGLPGLVVFKLLLQLVFAAAPVATYVWSRRFVPRHVALLGFALLVGFPTFFTDMPFIVRQEVGFLYLALALMAATQPGWGQATRRAVVCVAGVGMVVSHYSTTYVLILTIGCALGGAWATRLLMRRRGRPRDGRRPGTVLLSLPVLLALAAATWAWTSGITQTGGHLSGVVAQTWERIVAPDDPTLDSSDLGYGLFAPRPVPAQVRLDRTVKESFTDRPAGQDYLTTSPSQTDLRVDPVAELPLTPVGEVLDGVGVDVPAVNGMVRSLGAKALQGFLLLGLAVVMLRGERRSLPWELRWLALGSVGALGLQVVTPGLSAEYGILRAFQQTLFMTGPVVVLGCLALLRPLRSWAVPVTACLALTLVASLTGLLPRLLGGYPPQLSLSNSGLYHDLYYTQAPEADGMRWLAEAAAAAPGQATIVSDRYTLRRLAPELETDPATTDGFFPTRLTDDSFVFLSAATAGEGRAAVSVGGDLVQYRYPVRLLNRDKDLVYDNGTAEVFR